MYDLHDLLKDLCKRPGLYIKRSSITHLEHFYNGFCSSLYMNNIPDEKKSDKLCPLPFRFFIEYVANYYKTSLSTLNCFGIILKANNNDEEKSFDIFFELYNKFMVLDIEYCKKAALNRAHIDCYISKYQYNQYLIENENGDLKEVIEVNHDVKPPSEIYFIKLTDKSGYLLLINKQNEFTLWGIFKTLQKLKKHIKEYLCESEDLKWEKVKDYSIFDNIWDNQI